MGEFVRKRLRLAGSDALMFVLGVCVREGGKGKFSKLQGLLNLRWVVVGRRRDSRGVWVVSPDRTTLFGV